jgi:hypothetical protein
MLQLYSKNLISRLIFFSSHRDGIFVTADFNRRKSAANLGFCLVETAFLAIYVVSTRQKHKYYNICPPIEIGGYKYVVPTGPWAMSNPEVSRKFVFCRK